MLRPNIQRIRKTQGLSQDEVASAVNRITGRSIDRTLISYAECGKGCALWMAFALAKVLGCKVEDLFDLHNTQKRAS